MRSDLRPLPTLCRASKGRSRRIPVHSLSGPPSLFAVRLPTSSAFLAFLIPEDAPCTGAEANEEMEVRGANPGLRRRGGKGILEPEEDRV